MILADVRERGNELLDQNPLRGHHRHAIGAVLEPAQGRAGGRRSTCRSRSNPPSDPTSPPPKRKSISRRPSFANGTWVAVQFGIGGISTAISFDNLFNVGSYDSADRISRFGTQYSGWGQCGTFSNR
jgi:hypothetical protein